MDNKQLALAGIGMAKMIMDCAETVNDRALARAMCDAFISLWRLAEAEDEDKQSSALEHAEYFRGEIMC